MGLRGSRCESSSRDVHRVCDTVCEELLGVRVGLAALVRVTQLLLVYAPAPLTCYPSILWAALFGTFGKIFIPAHPTPKQHGQIRMKHAVWVDLVNMLLWFGTAIYSTIIWWRNRGGRTLHTGRAKV